MSTPPNLSPWVLLLISVQTQKLPKHKHRQGAGFSPSHIGEGFFISVKVFLLEVPGAEED